MAQNPRPSWRDEVEQRVARQELDDATLAVVEAAIAADDGLARAEDLAYAHVIASRCLEADGRFDEAIAQLDHADHHVPGHQGARKRRAAVEKQIAVRAKAEELLARGPKELQETADEAKAAQRDVDFQVEARRLLARTQPTPQAYCAVAAALRTRKNHRAALRAYEHARQLDSSAEASAMIDVGVAGVLRDLKRHAEAEQLAERAAHTSPNDWHALSVLAAVRLDRYETQRDPALFDDAERLIKRIPYREAHTLRGRLNALRNTGR